MRKILGALVLGTLLFSSCKKSDSTTTQSDPDQLAEMPVGMRNCVSYEVLQQNLKDDPSMKLRMDEIEAFTDRYMRGPQTNQLQPDGSMLVPVVVNVLYRTAAENISAAQIQSQIDVLNEDFAASNSDYNSTSTYNTVKSGDTKIRFVLDQVIRKQTNKTSWNTNDAMKKNNRGGISPTSPTTKLNLWVCNLGGGILGYAQFPGGSAATDGVVCDNNAFGRVGTAAAPFNKGRTATHEVGHWLNLRHIWGDASCGNDQVGDTPPHNTANYGCPTSGHKSTCTGAPVEMTMNYMDYTDDACMYMFSAGQKTRMLATYAVGGPRGSLR
ncbi:MAG: zinc metalloprotease [Chitinophagaceae bacterium]|nr:zinc metalloprotease [Chitinophagaceae bacterium]